ncbi:MAG TPA: LysR family transcriptional regulator [Burkholderiaceae bacterium]|jgi:DNA-binding transcriptional LysR family regulator|nr:LysR family transcriptional regulator [Burkholderiaceae bacterium]
MPADHDRLKRRVKLRDLDTLMAVAQAGGMRKAAEQLHMSQPAVSKAIAELEGALGVRLLDRTSKGVEPTVYGRALLRRGQVIFDELRQGVNEIGFLAEPGVGELSIGCGESLMASLVPAVIDRMHRQHPRLVFKMESGDPPVLLNHFLRERICEMVMLRPWELLTDPDLHVEPLFHERIAVVADARSAWARRRKLGLAELIDEPWILSHVEVRPGSPVMQAFEDQGIGLPKNLILSGSLNLRYSLLATGRYLTVMPSTVLKFCPGRGAVKALPVELPRWPIPTVVATLRHRVLSSVAKLFTERARELSAGL